MRYIDLIEDEIKAKGNDAIYNVKQLIDEGIWYGDAQCKDLLNIYNENYSDALYYAYFREHWADFYKNDKFVEYDKYLKKYDEFLKIYKDVSTKESATRYFERSGRTMTGYLYIKYCLSLVFKPLIFALFECAPLSSADANIRITSIFERIQSIKGQIRLDIDGLTFKNCLPHLIRMLTLAYKYKLIIDKKSSLNKYFYKYLSDSIPELEKVSALSNWETFNSCCQAMVEQNSTFLKTSHKKFLSNKYFYSFEALKASYESIAIVYSFAFDLLNTAQKEYLQKSLDNSISNVYL